MVKYFRPLTKLPFFLLLLITLSILTFSGECYSGTYYVDFDAGNDANNGTSTNTPWRSLPGTYGKSAWGAITSSNKIPAPSTIYIKAGTTHSGADPNPGNTSIDATYYTSPAQESERITIAVSSNWGTGNATIDGGALSYGASFTSLLFSVRLPYITVRGNDETRRLVFQNAETAGKYGVIAKGASSGSHTTGVIFDYLTVQHCAYGLVMSWTDNFLIDHLYASGNNMYGVGVGDSDDTTCNIGTFQNSTLYQNGSVANHGSAAGVVVISSTNITLKNIIADGNIPRNYNYGSVSNAIASTVTTVNCVSRNAQEVGFRGSGGPGKTDQFIYTFINCISYNDNPTEYSMGSFHFYDGCTVYLYHCIVDKSYTGGGASIAFSFGSELNEGGVKIYAKNNVGYFPTTGTSDRFMYLLHAANSTTDPVTIMDMDYNTYDISGTRVFARSWVEDLSPAISDLTFGQWQATTRHKNRPDTYSSTSTSIATYWANVMNHNYTITSTSSPLYKQGTYLTTPQAVLIDGAGVARGNPPTVGPYEYLIQGVPAPPTNLKVGP